MSLNNEKILECFDELHESVGHFMRLSYPDEAYEATMLLMSTVICSKCILFKSNIEHTMEETFNEIADYVYGILEDKSEDA